MRPRVEFLFDLFIRSVKFGKNLLKTIPRAAVFSITTGLSSLWFHEIYIPLEIICGLYFFIPLAIYLRVYFTFTHRWCKHALLDRRTIISKPEIMLRAAIS